MTPVAKRKAVVHLMEVHQVSQRRACDVLQVDRSSVRYLSRRGDDAELRDAIKRVSRERRRFGCRRVHVMIAREGFVVNHKKVRRIYTEEKLQVRRRGGRKRALGTRKPMVLPDGPNQRWSLDFVSDALTDGRRCFAKKHALEAKTDSLCRRAVTLAGRPTSCIPTSGVERAACCPALDLKQGSLGEFGVSGLRRPVCTYQPVGGCSSGHFSLPTVNNRSIGIIGNRLDGIELRAQGVTKIDHLLLSCTYRCWDLA